MLPPVSRHERARPYALTSRNPPSLPLGREPRSHGRDVPQHGPGQGAGGRDYTRRRATMGERPAQWPHLGPPVGPSPEPAALRTVLRAPPAAWFGKKGRRKVSLRVFLQGRGRTRELGAPGTVAETGASPCRPTGGAQKPRRRRAEGGGWQTGEGTWSRGRAHTGPGPPWARGTVSNDGTRTHWRRWAGVGSPGSHHLTATLSKPQRGQQAEAAADRALGNGVATRSASEETTRSWGCGGLWAVVGELFRHQH